MGSHTLHADVSDGKDLSRNQQEVTDGQLFTMSLVPGTVHSDVASECHLGSPPFTYRGGVHINCTLPTCLKYTICESVGASGFVRERFLELYLDFFSCWSHVELRVWNV